MKFILFISCFSLSIASFSQGYLHADGQNIVDGNGKNVLLRGLGLGGWMIQEGYMLKTSDFAGPQREIRKAISDVIGASRTEMFYQAYRDSNVTSGDIDSLKVWGFNSVRLPIHYNLFTLPIESEKEGENMWLAEGFQRTHELLKWCAKNKMYLILDIHAAPGGQGKDANISDYDPMKHSLWESEANKQKLIALWVQLAKRYKNEPWIGGYDLINEPNWNFTGTNQNGCDEKSNEPLRTLQIDITKAIREHDKNHIIFIEGNCWGNNYNGIFPLWDDNLVLSFHKYWNFNTQASIQNMLNYRSQYNVPIWLGESGENSNAWFTDAISLMEQNNIGWAFWPMKKIDNLAGVTSVKTTPEYEELLKMWKEKMAMPDPEKAFSTLMQIADNYKMENVVIKYDVLDAMFRQVRSDETRPYIRHKVPGIVFATDYDLGKMNQAYFDTTSGNYWVDSGVRTPWNEGGKMRNDGVDIEACTDTRTNGYQVAFIEPKEWLQFTITSKPDTEYDVNIRYAGSAGKVYFADADGKISGDIDLPDTGGFQTWKTFTATGINLKNKKNKLKLVFEKGGFNLNYLEFKVSGKKQKSKVRP
jgi:endoglucanase